jgi:signal transduction histidine kinase
MLGRVITIFGLGRMEVLIYAESPGKASSRSQGRLAYMRLLNGLAQSIHGLLDIAITTQITFEHMIHEVGLCLAAIDGAAGYVEAKTRELGWADDATTMERVTDNVDIILQQTSLGRALVWNQMRYLTAQRARIRSLFRPSTINLTREINQLVLVWSRAAAKKKIEFRVNLDDLPLIMGDRQLLRQLFHNILSNAIKYSYTTTDRSQPRYIDLDWALYDPGFRRRRVAIHVSNYGIGIPDEEVSKLGSLGFRGRYAKEEQPIGFGIGLYVAMEIARVHGGTIKISSKYLHDTRRELHGREIVSPTYLVECLVVLPIA